MSPKLETIYRYLRIAIFAIPAVVIAVGAFLVFFPSETFHSEADASSTTSFTLAKDVSANSFSFGVYPTLEHRFIDLDINFKSLTKEGCRSAVPTITVRKTYQSFLYPDGSPISTPDQLHQVLFENNPTKFPNGSLLHFKPTDEVFLMGEGQKIAFPGPEIFRAFGYSFENLTEVDKATLDQIPNANRKTLAWDMPSPDGTVFKTYPSHKLFVISQNEKHEISDPNILDDVWPQNFTIPVNDNDDTSSESCPTPKTQNNSLRCRFDDSLFSQSFGGFYNFSIEYPKTCPVSDIHPGTAFVSFIPEKSFSTVKNSMRTIFASVLNRYLGKQQ